MGSNRDAAFGGPERRAAIEAVFDEALDVPTDRRAAWLA